MEKKRILVFASGGATGGGSGFQEMVEYSRTDPPVLPAKICGVVSNHRGGGVYSRARQLDIPFRLFNGPFKVAEYKEVIREFKPDLVMLSGWLKKVAGLCPAKTINIHPGPLPDFGGPGMYGHHVHEAVIDAYKEKRIKQSAVTMHFVTEEYDEGPVFFRMPVLIRPDDTSETLAKRVNEVERAWQSYMVSLVLRGDIYLANDKAHFRSGISKFL
ncbi:MAG: formyltransferase family protein [Patescibacteria group bacterium]